MLAWGLMNKTPVEFCCGSPKKREKTQSKPLSDFLCVWVKRLELYKALNVSG